MTIEVPLLRQDKPIGYVITKSGERMEILPDSSFVKAFNALVDKTGGQKGDAIAEAGRVASQALTTAVAVGLAVPLPETSGVTLALVDATSLVDILSVQSLSASQARIHVAAHTRSGAAAPLTAGYVDVSRGDENGGGVTYTVHYVDPGNVGGLKTFLATDNPASVGATRVIGVVHVPAYVRLFSGVVNRSDYEVLA